VSGPVSISAAVLISAQSDRPACDNYQRKSRATPSSTIESKLAATSTVTNRLSRLIPNSIGITTGMLCVSLAQAKMTQPQMRKPPPGLGSVTASLRIYLAAGEADGISEAPRP
jgi:hypothetical protein